MPNLIAKCHQLIEIGDQALPALLPGCRLDEACGRFTVLPGVLGHCLDDPHPVPIDARGQ